MTSPDGAAACRVSPDRLRAFASAVFRHHGLTADDAALCADTLVQADLWGHQSHGVLRLPWYAARLKTGACDPDARPEIVTDAGGIAVIDGHEAMGQVVTARAAHEAIARARRHGIAAVAVRNSNHFGTAMYFTLMAPPAGCIAFLATNASPAMAPWGGRRKSVGTNPWSWAVPAGDRPPLVLDIANTAAARGKIYLARQEGRPIPEGWALTAEGAPTTDPTEAIAGIILPMAQHKGYGIALVMDVLAGVLTGSAFGAAVSGPYESDRRSGAGHLMIVIDELITSLKRAPTAPGFDEVLYPGEIEARADAENRRLGIPLPDDTRADLVRLAAETGLSEMLPF